MKKTAGFTLVELMIIVAIISILAAIGVPNFIYARRRALLASCETNLKAVATAVSIYNTDTKTWPANLNVLLDEEYLDKVNSIQCPLNAPTQYSFERFYPGSQEYDNLGRVFEVECLNTTDGGGPLTHVGKAGPKSTMKILKYVWGLGIFTLEE